MTKNIYVPDEYKHLLNDSKSRMGILGLSVGKQDFYNEEIMHSYCSFLQDTFAYSMLLIGDLPKKWNIMALEGASEDKATRKAMIAGEDLRNKLEKITRDHSFVKVSRWSDFMNEQYRSNLNFLRSAYEQDIYFRNSVNERTLDFLSLPANKAKWPNGEPPISLSKEYVLDETAYLLAIPFSCRLPVCEIYPGRNNVQEDIQEGRFNFGGLHVHKGRVFVEAHYA